jgi:hypothetical protein
MKQLLYTIIITSLCFVPLSGQINILVQEPDVTSFKEHEKPLCKLLHSSLLAALASDSAFRLVDRKNYDEDGKSNWEYEVDGAQSLGLVGAEYLLTYKYLDKEITVETEGNYDKEPGEPAQITKVKILNTIEVEFLDVESGLMISSNKFKVYFKKSLKAYANDVIGSTLFAFNGAIGTLGSQFVSEVKQIIFKNVTYQVDVLAEAYRRGKRLSGVIINLSVGHGFNEGQSFDLYKISQVKVGDSSIDKKEFLCKGSLFNSYANYSTLLVRKGSKKLDDALKKEENVVAELSLD